MHYYLLATIVISICLMILEGIVVFKNLNNKLHAYLILNCIAMLINNTGYLLQLISKDEEAYIAALKFSYAGRVWIVFSLLMFTAELVHIKIPKLVIGGCILINIVVYGFIFTVQNHTFYYSKILFDRTGLFPVLLHRNGPVHKLFMQYQLVVIIMMLICLFRHIKSHTGKIAKKRAWIIIGGFFISAILYVIQIEHVFFITYYFDISVIGNVAITISMYIAIFRYNLLGVIDMARDYIVDRLSEGVIAVGENGKVQYFNEHVKEIFPEITVDPASVVSNLQEIIKNGNSITVQDRYYSPEEKELYVDGERIGKLYALVDTTVLKEREYKLKSDAAMLEMAANSMRDRLDTAEELLRQDRTMRHDRRHFEALLLSLVQDGKLDEVKKCLEERLAQEPHSSRRYCDNTTINAAILHYVTVAERKDIKVNVSTNIPFDTGVDDMQLAIVISNLIENAIHACEKVLERERYISITAKYKEQLLLEIANSCETKTKLDEDGYPISPDFGHGIGTKSVLDFVKKTNSDIRYIAEDNKFKVRMIIGG